MPEKIRGKVRIPGSAHGEEGEAGAPEHRPSHYWQYCVNCGTLLESRKCKLFCPRCGFYHSCSEP